MPTKHLLIFLLLCMVSAANTSAKPDTVSIYFPFNQARLTDSALNILDNALYSGILSDAQPVQIIGYTDEVGSNNYNLNLSRNRAESVKTYLLQSGFKDEQITLIIGKGELLAGPANSPDGNPIDRRVDIISRMIPVPANPAITITAAVKRPPRKASTTDWKTVSIGETILIDNIYFYAGRHYVRKESDAALDALYEALEANATLRVSIEGHVCCVPATVPDAVDDDTHRMELSLNRARVIRDYLIRRGIAANRIEYAGFGRKRPVVQVERTEEDADQNRRVEIRVIP